MQHFWRELHSLVIDGIAVTRQKLGMKARSAARPGGGKAMSTRLVAESTDDQASIKEGGKRKSGTKEPKKNKKPSKDRGSRKNDSGEASGTPKLHSSPLPAENPAAPSSGAPAAAGTAAGGGGRWVHVPN